MEQQTLSGFESTERRRGERNSSRIIIAGDDGGPPGWTCASGFSQIPASGVTVCIDPLNAHGCFRRGIPRLPQAETSVNHSDHPLHAHERRLMSVDHHILTAPLTTHLEICDQSRMGFSAATLPSVRCPSRGTLCRPFRL